MARALAGVYWALARHRRELVIQNLLPPLNGDRAAASRKGRELIQQFAVKVADLLRYENGQGIENRFGEWTGWDAFTKVLCQKRGGLLINPHSGNWEFGGAVRTR